MSKLPAELRSFIVETTGSVVASTELVQTLWSGYGQILRCHLQGPGPQSVIVKHVRWPSRSNHPRGWNSDLSHQRKVRSYEVESAWYQEYAPRCGARCRVPSCIAMQSRGDEVSILLEDLNEAGFPGRRSHCSEGELHACIDWLARFHARFMGQEPEGLWPIGTYWHLDTRPEEHQAIADAPLRAAAAEIDAKLNQSRYRTLVHGDAKLANFCFSSDGLEVAAVDFQYVGGGCGMKDLAYFISSCLDEEQCQEREDELLAWYFQALQAALREVGNELDFSALEADWRALYPVAWTDFYRFLQGWSPGHWKLHRYSERLAREVLATL